MAQGFWGPAPSGEERCTPNHTVPVSPQCPQEIGLPTLPVFQGAAISSERFSQSLPPGKVAVLGGSPPLRGSLEQLDRPSPAGPPLQGTELAALSAPEASLERLVPLVGHLAVWEPLQACLNGSYLSRLWFYQSSLPRRWRGSEDRHFHRRLQRQSWCPWPRTYEGRPLWGRAGYTALHGARLSSVPSGDRSTNPASVPGRSGLQRALLSVSPARKRSGTERLATPSGVSRAARAAVPCQSSASGHRASSSKHTRGQSWETGSLSRLFGSVETTAKCVSMGPAHCRMRLRFSAPPPPFNWVIPTLVGQEQARVMEQEVNALLRKETIEVVPPLDRESGFYSRYFIVPKEDGGLCPILDLCQLNRSVMRLKFRMLSSSRSCLRPGPRTGLSWSI